MATTAVSIVCVCFCVGGGGNDGDDGGSCNYILPLLKIKRKKYAWPRINRFNIINKKRFLFVCVCSEKEPFLRTIEAKYRYFPGSRMNKICWDLGRINSPTSARRGDGLENIRICETSPKKLIIWDGAPSPSSGIRAMPRT